MTWLDEVERMLERFIPLSCVEEIFGKLEHRLARIIQGYGEGIFAEKPFYFGICWHEYIQDMGIAIRFSAHAWAYFQAEYENKYHEEMNVLRFLKMVQSDDLYTMRLSKIDLTADYKNYGLQVHKIYHDLKNHKLQIVNWKMNRTNLKMSALEKDGAAETIYLGSRRENTRGFLRIYDKRDEQVAKSGFRLDEALATDNWVRFEAVFKGKYAHQITESLLTDVPDSIALQKFIAQKITDKYIFFIPEKDDVAGFSDELAGLAKGSPTKHLRSESPRDNSLRRSIKYLRNNAGLFPVVYKIHCIYGEDGVKQFWEHLQEEYTLYKPNRDVHIWLNKHYSTMIKQPLVDSFF